MILVTVFAFTIFITSLVYRLSISETPVPETSQPSRNVIDMDLEVGVKTGINADTDALHFGRIKPGDSVTRSFQIHNFNNKSIRVDLKVEGDLAEWTTLSNPTLVLLPNQSFKEVIIVQPPKNTDLGNYTSQLIIEKRVHNGS